MLRAGLAVEDREIALVCASHSGTPMQVALAQSILRTAGVDVSALRNTPGLPLDETAMRELITSGGSADSSHQNCSGKHAGMLATCVHNDWPADNYLDPEHSLQRILRETLEQLTGEEVTAVGVDGCGAPLFALSSNGLATAFAKLV